MLMGDKQFTLRPHFHERWLGTQVSPGCQPSDVRGRLSAPGSRGLLNGHRKLFPRGCFWRTVPLKQTGIWQFMKYLFFSGVARPNFVVVAGNAAAVNSEPQPRGCLYEKRSESPQPDPRMRSPRSAQGCCWSQSWGEVSETSLYLFTFNFNLFNEKFFKITDHI